jgi:hypothetical protein
MVPSPVTVLMEEKAGSPLHSVLPGPKTLNVMVPVGETPPASIAVSKMAPPMVTVGDAVVLMVGLANVTTASSSPQDDETPLLAVLSPL